MNSEDFIEALKLYVRDPATEGIISNLEQPPGRRVSADARSRSEWYKSLSPTEIAYVNDIIAKSTHAALFGFLVVLDGDSKISDEEGRFELAFVGDRRVVLNDPQEISLHELLNAPT